MKCIFCNNPAGFMKMHHDECANTIQNLLQRMEQVLNQCDQAIVSAKDAKTELITVATSETLYKNYLKHRIYDETAIKTKEVALYYESLVAISESKNRCEMTRTGYRYEKKPVWSKSDHLICYDASIVLTDKSVYMLMRGSAMSYQYSKIVNVGFDEKWGYAYFDVKTSSPFPHRFSVNPLDKKDKNKTQIVYRFLNCLAT